MSVKVLPAIFILLSLGLGEAVGERATSPFKDDAERIESTWLNAPRKQNTDSSPFDTSKQTPQRQLAFKKRCSAFNDTWLNAPRKQNTDSSLASTK